MLILRDLAQQKGLFLVEAITVPHLPNFRMLPDHLHEIGPLKLVQLNFSQYSSKHKAFLEGKNPNVFNPAFAGGALVAMLWEIGRQVLAAYVLRRNLPTAYGVIGSFMAIMLWTYSAMIVILFGAASA